MKTASLQSLFDPKENIWNSKASIAQLALGKHLIYVGNQEEKRIM